MGTVFLVRHGQASFGADDYDQLSALGRRQCVQLGRYLAERGGGFDAVLTGTLRRQRQSFEGLREGWGAAMPEAVEWPELNEYDSEAVIRSISPGPLERPTSPEAVRQHFLLLRQGLLAWMAGQAQPEGMPTHAEFLAGLRRALQSVQHLPGRVLVVSSGGPISNLVGALLQASPEATVALNLRIRNASVTELDAQPRRLSLVGFNSVAHLDHPDLAGWITHT